MLALGVSGEYLPSMKSGEVLYHDALRAAAFLTFASPAQSSFPFWSIRHQWSRATPGI